jgi:hypothetical protein
MASQGSMWGNRTFSAFAAIGQPFGQVGQAVPRSRSSFLQSNNPHHGYEVKYGNTGNGRHLQDIYTINSQPY